MAKTAETFSAYCKHCGYTLRGLSDPRCPECIWPVAEAAEDVTSYSKSHSK